MPKRSLIIIFAFFLIISINLPTIDAQNNTDPNALLITALQQVTIGLQRFNNGVSLVIIATIRNAFRNRIDPAVLAALALASRDGDRTRFNIPNIIRVPSDASSSVSSNGYQRSSKKENKTKNNAQPSSPNQPYGKLSNLVSQLVDKLN
jgi:hypothetical protein